MLTRFEYLAAQVFFVFEIFSLVFTAAEVFIRLPGMSVLGILCLLCAFAFLYNILNQYKPIYDAAIILLMMMIRNNPL